MLIGTTPGGGYDVYARALARHHGLLVDEAPGMRQALEHLMEGRTTLVIAHRLATVRDADEIGALARAIQIFNEAMGADFTLSGLTIANCTADEELERLTEELVDRFGPLPDPTTSAPG